MSFFQLASGVRTVRMQVPLTIEESSSLSRVVRQYCLLHNFVLICLQFALHLSCGSPRRSSFYASAIASIVKWCCDSFCAAARPDVAHSGGESGVISETNVFQSPALSTVGIVSA